MTLVSAAPPEQTRARYPDSTGHVERDGQRTYYEVYGDGDETVFLLPPWSIVHARHWKMQIPYLARHFRVLVMDALGNGRSDRCRDPERYAPSELARDAIAVMDATGTDRAVLAGVSRGAQCLLHVAQMRPERVVGVVFLAPMFPYTLSHWRFLLHPRIRRRFTTTPPVSFGWVGHINAVRWREDYAGF